MAKTKTSSVVKERYNSKAYDDIRLRIPKGQKATVQAHADSKGESINAMVNRAILTDMGLEEWPQGNEE